VLLVVAGLLEKLLMQTAKEEPEIRELFQDSGLQDLTKCIIVTNPRHVGAGAYADVFETELLQLPSQQPKKVPSPSHGIKGKIEVICLQVAVKVLKIYQEHVDAKDGMKLAQIRRVN